MTCAGSSSCDPESDISDVYNVNNVFQCDLHGKTCSGVQGRHAGSFRPAYLNKENMSPKIHLIGDFFSPV